MYASADGETKEPPLEDRAAAGPGAPDAGSLEPESGPDAGRAAAAAAGSDGVGFDRLGGCLGSFFFLCTKTGGGFRGLEVVSLFPSLCSSGFLCFLQKRLICPNSPQLKHRTDSVDRKTR